MGLRTRRLPYFCLSISLLLASTVAQPCAEIIRGEERRLPKITPITLRYLNRLVDSPNNLYEMKYDGYRAIAYFDPDRPCRFVSRTGVDLTQFKKLCEAIAKKLKIENAIFDGEVIALDPSGRPIFNKLLRHEGPYKYVAFDLLWFNGEDLRSLSLAERRKRLLEILPDKSPFITEPLAVVGSGRKLFDLMTEHDLEGIVVKRLEDKYSRSTKWYKFKNKYYSQAIGRRHFFR